MYFSLNRQFIDTYLVLQAKESFDNASKIFMSDTLTEGHKLRPKGIWGFYQYPLCNLKPEEKTCAPEVVEINNQ